MSLSRSIAWLLMLVVALVVSTVGGPVLAAEQQADSSHGSAEHGSHISDPNHGNMSDEALNPIEFRTDINIFTAVVFLLLLVGLYFSAWRPIMEGLEKREKTIAGNIQAAEQAKLDAQSKLAEYEAKLADASQEATRIVADARKGAEQAAARIEAEAQEEAARHRERTAAEIEAAKRVALGELAAKSTDVAMALAQRIVGREVKAADHQKLIQEMLSQLPSKN